MNHVTTPDEFKQFKKHCLKWIDKLGLKAWSITFTHDKDDGNRASVGYSITDRVATINLGQEWEAKPTTHLLERVAFHECMHIVTAPLYGAGKSRFLVEAELEQADHIIVRTIEQLIFGDQ